MLSFAFELSALAHLGGSIFVCRKGSFDGGAGMVPHNARSSLTLDLLEPERGIKPRPRRYKCLALSLSYTGLVCGAGDAPVVL